MEEKFWKNYIESSKNKKPRPLAREALSYITTGKEALDLGGGNLNDVKFFIQEGFHVTEVDQSPSVHTVAKDIDSEKITICTSKFTEYDFPREHFDFVNAQLSLPFQTKEEFSIVFPKIIQSLKPGGVFAFDLFGTNHEWNSLGDSTRIFFSHEDVLNLLKDLTIIKNNETEFESRTELGNNPIHWHKFDIIIKK